MLAILQCFSHEESIQCAKIQDVVSRMSGRLSDCTSDHLISIDSRFRQSSIDSTSCKLESRSRKYKISFDIISLNIGCTSRGLKQWRMHFVIKIYFKYISYMYSISSQLHKWTVFALFLYHNSQRFLSICIAYLNTGTNKRLKSIDYYVVLQLQWNSSELEFETNFKIKKYLVIQKPSTNSPFLHFSKTMCND